MNIDMPQSWVASRLGDVADVRLGKMLDKGRPKGSPHKYLRNINIRWDAIDTSDLLSMSFEDHELERFGIRNGDLLVCEGGEPGRAAVWSHGETDLKYQKALHRIRLPDPIAARWVMYQLMLDAWSGRLSRSFTGSTIAHLPREKLVEYELRVAPRREQQRVVEAVDSYLTRLDDAVASLERVQAKLKAYRASVLKAAVEGRLVPTEASLAHTEKRGYEPAQLLLDRILKERRRSWEEAELVKLKTAGKTPKDNRWKAKYQEPQPPDTSTLPELREGWCLASVDQLTDGARNSGYGVLVPGPDVTDGVPLVRVGDIHDGTVSTSELKRIDRAIADQFAKTYLRGGEVLLSLVGTIGRSAVVPSGLSGANVARAVGVIPTSSLVRSRWVEIWLRSPRIQALMNSRAHEVARKTLNLEDVRAAAVVVPPVGEQDRIIAEAEYLESVAVAASSTVAADSVRCVRLRQAILKWAFEGKLVDQDPADEPADKLLARIRPERAAAAPAKTNGGRKVKGAA